MVEHIFIIALFTLGYCCTFWEGMIFECIGNWMECNLPAWLWKPLGGCYICACMWIGAIPYWVLWGNDIQPRTLLDCFVTCAGAMGVNVLVSFVSRIGEEQKTVYEERVERIYYYPVRCRGCGIFNYITDKQEYFTCTKCQAENGPVKRFKAVDNDTRTDG